MFRFIIFRLGQSVVALLALLALVFLMTRLTGNPTDLYLPVSATPEQRQEFTERHGLSDPLFEQFIRYVSNLVHGDFGDSLFQRRPALEIVLEAFPTTLSLAALALGIAIPIALLLGSVASIRPGSALDRIISMITIACSSTPAFVLSLIAILVLSIRLHWLPTSGIGTPYHWVMPVLVLVIGPCGVLTQVVRGSMVEALHSDYVKTAQAKGATPSRVLFIHALRNALLPVIAVAGVQAGGLINGAVVAETVFGFPGIGRLMMESIQRRDFAVTVACIFVAAILVYLLNLVIDILYSRLDPRVKLGGSR